jgi:hypothetical protein
LQHLGWRTNFLSSMLQRIPYVFYWVEDGQEAGQSILTTPAC